MLRSSLQSCCLSFRRNTFLEARRTWQCASKRAASVLSTPIQEDESEEVSGLQITRTHKYQRSKEVYTSPTATLGHYGAVATRNPSATPFQQLVSEIPQLSQQNLTLHDFRARVLVVLLITPSFAHILDAPHNPLLGLQNRLFGSAKGGKSSLMELQVLAAVVDRIPAPSAIPVEHEPYSVTSRTFSPPVANDGLEGLAYAVMSPAALGRPESTPETNESMPALSIKMRGKRDSRNSFTLDYEVSLPLANTIFQNGREHTMRHYIFRRKKKYAQFTLKSTKSHKRHAITWPAHVSGKFGQDIISLSTPLVPLTVPLRIEAAMGNIISRVTDHNSKIAPASQQLEASVNEYFTATNSPPHAVSVWALMYPSPSEHSMRTLETYREDTGILSTSPLGTSSQKNIQSFWQSKQGWNDHVLRSVWRGAKLHRVVSGGGGWGKKAGLLSLDPYSQPLETSPAADEASGPTSFNFMKGDYIQFFICPPIKSNYTPVMDTAHSAPREWSLEFGSMTSAMDAMPLDKKSDASCEAEVQMFPNHFGAISEKGFTIQNTYAQETDRGHDSFKTFAYTKVDVPHSRWSAVSTIAPSKERSMDSIPGAIVPPGVLQVDPLSKQPRRFDDLGPESPASGQGHWDGVRFNTNPLLGKIRPVNTDVNIVSKSPSWSAQDLPPARRAWLLLQREQRHREGRKSLRQMMKDTPDLTTSTTSTARMTNLERSYALRKYERTRVFIRDTYVTQRPRNRRERAVGRHYARDHFIRHIPILSSKDAELLRKNNETGVEVRRLDGGYGAERRQRRRLRALLLREKNKPPPAPRLVSDPTKQEAEKIQKYVDDILKGFGNA